MGINNFVISMNSAQLINRLDKLGIKIRIDTLRSWAKQGLIPEYKTYYESRPKKQPGRPPKPGSKKAKEREEREKEKKRPGHYSTWPSDTVEEVAAVWAVRQCAATKHEALTSEMIEVIKRAAAVLDERPFAVYTLPPVTGPLSTQHIAPEDINIKFVSEDFDGLDLFPGPDNTKKAERLNELVVIWVAAIEKVRVWKYEGIKVQVESELGSEWEDHLTEIDFSQIDPWKVVVPCPWQIDKPARVTLIWWSWDSEFWKPLFPSQTPLSESDFDDLILSVNLVDTRTFFRIDVIDGAGSVKARLEEIERRLEETERKMRSSASPVEKVTLNIHREQLNIYREQFKNLFHI